MAPAERNAGLSSPVGRSAWRLIASGPGTGPWNLALDEAIFQSVRAGARPPTLRLYRWSTPTLSIGYAQDRDADVDIGACRARGIEVIRRVTGGRAVLHDAEVTYSVSAPAGLPGFGTGLDEAYRRIAAGLIAGLRLLGLEAAAPATAPRDRSRSPRGAACFGAAARHEIAVGGRKLIGSAQRRDEGAFLQHGSILLESHALLMNQLLRSRPAAAGAPPMTGLADLLPHRPTPGSVEAAIAAGCSAVWGVRFLPGEVSRAEERAARALEAGRYRSVAWNAGSRAAAGVPGLADLSPRLGGMAGFVDMRPAGS